MKIHGWNKIKEKEVELALDCDGDEIFLNCVGEKGNEICCILSIRNGKIIMYGDVGEILQSEGYDYESFNYDEDGRVKVNFE